MKNLTIDQLDSMIEDMYGIHFNSVINFLK